MTTSFRLNFLHAVPFHPNWSIFVFDNFMSGPADGPDARSNDGIPEAQKILQGLLAELPDEAQILVDKVNRELVKIQENQEAEVSRIREQAENQISEEDR